MNQHRLRALWPWAFASLLACDRGSATNESPPATPATPTPPRAEDPAPQPAERIAIEEEVVPGAAFAWFREQGDTFDFRVDLQPGGSPAMVVFEGCQTAYPDCLITSGRLKPSGRARAARLRDELVRAQLLPRYGAPGLADGPVYTIVLPSPNGTATRHVYDRLEAVADVLKPTTNFLRAIAEALATCTSTAEVLVDKPCKRNASESHGRVVPRPSR